MMIRNLFLKKNPSRTPMWFMRQAGRYLPEYMAIRRHFDDFIQFCYTPEMAAEVTLQPMRRFDLDAAIIFSDILVIPDALGQKVTFQKDHGPVLGEYSLSTFLKKTPDHITHHLGKVYDAIALTRSKLEKDKELFGFSGTPWTLACYMVEEGKSQYFHQIIHYSADADFKTLLTLLTETIALHLINQIEAGADMIQVVVSWAIKVPVG
ncbi:MAG: uroporphyrinogen decarboxylase, partial [Alphaproteobacteria bacterium]|nr:uroporphyrinogen decarboxylase [Alphaproteobacteria bacterium]